MEPPLQGKKMLKSQVLEKLKSFLPPQWYSWMLYTFSRNSRLSWGGPFNGQQQRIQVFLEIIDLVNPKAIIETGTYRGTTTEFIAKTFRPPILTIESDPHNFYYSRIRLRRYKNVCVFEGSSPQVLEGMSRDPGLSKEAVFFYLDAHWKGKLPAREELPIIRANWRDYVVMIDDFQVPGDAGYGFESYKNGAIQDLDHFNEVLTGMSIFFPALASQTETGSQRGCIVLAQGSTTSQLLKARYLRPYKIGSKAEPAGFRST